MKKLTKDQLARHAQLCTDLASDWEDLEAAVKQYNEKVAVAHSELQAVVETFNKRVAEANEFVEEVHSEQESFFDEKSERWQESDAGSAYQDWMTQWGDKVVEEVELDWPPEFDVDVDIESFGQLETECST